MFDFIPWMDEVHIVEMGRNFLSIASAKEATILTLSDGMPFVPLYYVGPTLQELLFRAFGETGVRLSPIIGTIFTSVTLAWFMKAAKKYSRITIIATSLMAVTLPILVQSTRLVRVDSWVFCLCFLACGLLARRKYKTAAVVAAATPFVWPSAIMLAPIYLMVHIENRENNRKLIFPFMLALCAFAVLFLPLLRVFSMASGSLSYYFAIWTGNSISSGKLDLVSQVASLAVPIAKETLRAPFFLLIAYAGVIMAFTRHRLLLLAFSIAFIVGFATGLHTFRYIYLMPYFLLFAADALEYMSERMPKAAHAAATTAILYGIACGPFAYAVADLRKSPNNIHAMIAERFKDVPAGTKVFAPGYSTYYALRDMGLNQIAIPNDGEYADEKRVSALLMKCDCALLESEDKFTAIEETYTLYGLIRDLCLESARQECSSATKSFRARIGCKFAYGDKPPIEHLLIQHGFSKEGVPFHSCGREYRVFKKTLARPVSRQS